MASVIDSVDTEVTELCRALPVMDEDDMLGLSELKFESDGAKKLEFGPCIWPCIISG